MHKQILKGADYSDKDRILDQLDSEGKFQQVRVFLEVEHLIKGQQWEVASVCSRISLMPQDSEELNNLVCLEPQLNLAFLLLVVQQLPQDLEVD